MFRIAQIIIKNILNRNYHSKIHRPAPPDAPVIEVTQFETPCTSGTFSFQLIPKTGELCVFCMTGRALEVAVLQPCKALLVLEQTKINTETTKVRNSDFWSP